MSHDKPFYPVSAHRESGQSRSPLAGQTITHSKTKNQTPRARHKQKPGQATDGQPTADGQGDTRGTGSVFLDSLEARARARGSGIDVRFWEIQCVEGFLQIAKDDSLDVKPLSMSQQRLKVVRRRFLDRFKYAHMEDRQTQIDDAHEKTFRWIWETTSTADQSWSSFPQWLASSSSLYWITGKVRTPPHRLLY